MRAFEISLVDTVLHTRVCDVEATPASKDDILVRVEYSGVNFKDAMVVDAASRVRRSARLVGGVDAAGVIEQSSDPTLPEGTRVAVHGGDLGVARDGGFAEFVYAPSRYLSPLPEGLSTRQAMIAGTAGLSAMASVLALEDHGLTGGPVLVTGATGGVGSFSVALLHARGHEVTASTGSAQAGEWLRELGASQVIGRHEVTDRIERVLGSELWAGAIDCVGGDTLAQVIRSLRYGAAVAASGLVAGVEINTTVYPFITRSVALLGVDVVEMRHEDRARTWLALAASSSRLDFESLVDSEIGLDGLDSALSSIRDGATRGRILVNPTPGA